MASASGDHPAPPGLDREAYEKEFPGTSASAAEMVGTLVRTGEAFVALANRALHRHHLSIAAREALAVLDGADGPLPATTVADRLIVTSGSMTSLIDTLERKGLVERRPDPGDRRRVLVALTADGRGVVDRFLPEMAVLLTRVTADIPESDRDAVVRTLTALRAAIARTDPRSAVADPVPPRRRPATGRRPGERTQTRS